MVTELVKFRKLETVTDQEFLSKVDYLNDFQKKQDGFINAELVKNFKENEWYLVYHFSDMEKVKAIGDKLRSEKVIDNFLPVIVPSELSITFFESVKTW